MFENISASLNFEFIFWFFSFSGFWIWNFEIFSWFSHLWFGLRIFSEFSGISQPGICTLKLFFTQVLLELNFKSFLKFFQTQLTWTGLWKFFEIFSTLFDWSWMLKIFKFFSNLHWLWLNFENVLNMYTHMIELVYNCWTLLTFTNPTVLYLVYVPPSKV